MKKLLLTTMIASMLILPFGTVALADDEGASLPAGTEYLEPVYIVGGVPADCTMAQAISPAIHAMILAMNNHGVCQYTATDDSLAWESLYNLLSMYGQLDDRSEYQDGLLVLPRETVNDFSCALLGYTITSESVPAFLADRMWYDADSDSYLLVCGNDELCEVQFLEDSGSQLRGSLVYLVDGTPISSFCVTVDHADNLLGFQITQLTLAS